MTGVDDGWNAGSAYDAYMGRWSRPLARSFVAWLAPQAGARWLDLGCGTGALTEAICELAAPASVLSCDPSEPFVEEARRRVRDHRVFFVVAAAEDLGDLPDDTDWVVSGLVLNFVKDPRDTIAALAQRLRAGGSMAACVWDYGHGMEFLRVFWDAAVSLRMEAAEHDEGRRFPLCRPEALADLFRSAGLDRLETAALETPTRFADFADYWAAFRHGTGPAPAYVASLDARDRDALEQALRDRLAPAGGGPIDLVARAWACRGVRA